MGKLILNAIIGRLDALEQKTFGHVRRRLSKRQVAELDGCSTRSIDRGVERGIYAQPEIENGRCYWWSDNYRRASTTADTPTLKAARNPRLRGKSAQTSLEK